MHEFLTKKKDILEWLDAHDKYFTYYGEKALTIDARGQVSSRSEINLDTSKIEYLAVKFKKIDGNFTLQPYIQNNKFKKGILKSLAGCPVEVWGNFNCEKNMLKNLLGGPKEVGSNYLCSYNQIDSLKGIAKKMHSLNAHHNRLTNLKYFPQKIDTSVSLNDNRITDYDGLLESEVGEVIVFDRLFYDKAGGGENSCLVMNREELLEYVRAHSEKKKISKAINSIIAAHRFKI